MNDPVRWTVKVSKDTDISLRSYLAQHGLKKGDLSKFIEQAVQKEVFARTVAAIEMRHAETAVHDIDATIDDALREVRAEMWGKAHSNAKVKASAKIKAKGMVKSKRQAA
jgi:Ribbon-helix-helix domain